MAFCGVNNCPDTLQPPQSIPTKESVYWLCGALDILIVCSLLVTILFLDDIKNADNDLNEEQSKVFIEKVKKEESFWIKLS